ncbi:terpenoid cyclases/Protein prenyltransferase [Cryphonectria parasitica EP155]|uniref:Protein farnesyltransferase subunit beta n=1 Tax=Cryphonectria parasitica (strain ATCC 38755 / EP155) TaxID=660469 RepID=A0A9P4XUZ0_CRYP1|nr:terpenoid cyclases/Protein prenyltransferase [Cryphonectria parasitica EP155]KAF3761291.1 terpenoid cyclases/Protein prenyltransferase [Cryphonectria parasitica EP155]
MATTQTATSNRDDNGAAAASMISDLFTSWPPLKDDLVTATSTAQDETVNLCLPYLSGDNPDGGPYNEHGLPHIQRKRHVMFLRKQLGQLPAPFVAADASRPWFLYWCFNALSLLGEDVSPYRESLVRTAQSMQNESGGFGGGNGQLSHLATTYAIVLSLALVGGADAYEVVDRRALWKWLCSLKQPGGGFQMATGGEVDVRGAYCAAVIVSLLNLPLDLTPESPAWTPDRPTLYTKLADYVQRCQTFEGGISAHPDGEAHGAYAFCALGCLAILDSPDRIFPRYLNVPRLISWLSSRQYAPEGGFSGRTNKLVDGCYSHWVGGCWPLIEAALSGSASPLSAQPGRKGKLLLPPYDESLYSREGLIRYIMCCCQDLGRRGGLRDKPNRPSDAYHSCYVLSGLSSAQHKWKLAAEATTAAAASAALASWSVSPHLDEVQVFDEQDRIAALHPVYAVPISCVTDIKAYFAAKQGF